MSSSPTAASVTAPAALASAAASRPWTCPYCSLLCDGYALTSADAAALQLVGSDCPIAKDALARSAAPPQAAGPRIGARAATLDEALDQAAQRLAASRQLLIGGLGLDVAGARALYPLACATGAVIDGGAAMLHGLRALQDRGQFTTTFAEVRNRADVVVCIGPSPRASHPEIWRRLGLGEPLVEAREVAFVGTEADPALAALPRTRVTTIAAPGDLFDTVSQLAACVAGRRVPAPPEIVALAERLRAARYAVVLWNSAKLPAQGTLIVEAANAIVAELNRTTRAAALALGSTPGPLAAHQTITWMSGLPLRSRAGPLGLEHEPLRFDAKRLLAEGGADALLWIASFGNEAPRPDAPAGLPTVVIGHAALDAPADAVFIPVATPGLGDTGHLFRVDGNVVLALDAVRDDSLPRAVDVLKALDTRVRALKGAAR